MTLQEMARDEVEAIVINYLTEHQSATIEQLYKYTYDFMPYFQLKEVVFLMFKSGVLRRKLLRNFPTEYRLATRFPNFGKAYQPRKPRLNPFTLKQRNEVSMFDSCRERSKVYQIDLLLRSVREA